MCFGNLVATVADRVSVMADGEHSVAGDVSDWLALVWVAEHDNAGNEVGDAVVKHRSGIMDELGSCRNVS